MYVISNFFIFTRYIAHVALTQILFMLFNKYLINKYIINTRFAGIAVILLEAGNVLPFHGLY